MHPAPCRLGLNKAAEPVRDCVVVNGETSWAMANGDDGTLLVGGVMIGSTLPGLLVEL